MIPTLDQEAWLAKRLGQHGVFVGITTVESRRETFRAAIMKAGPATIIGTHPKTGKTENYEQYFERIYGVPFEVMA